MGRITMIAGLVCAAVIAGSTQVANAEQMEINAAASHIADTILKEGRTRVIVADFVGPKDQVNELGRELAQNLSDALVGANKDLTVLPRKGQIVTMNILVGACAEIGEGNAARALAKVTGAEIVVVGVLTRHSDWIDINIRIWDIPPRRGKGVEVWAANKLDEIVRRTPLTKEKGLLLDRLLVSAPVGEWRLTAGLGKSTLDPSVPQCLDCPNPPPMKQGTTVTLRITINVEGRVTATEVLKASDPKTTETVVKTVQKWRFKPASGLDGRPVESRTEVQINVRPMP